ncbi:MAG: hypothetical protein CL938_07240 [Deltaproteobacteria bacterium]|nr:hypothetical protein [Deltaproteobacteria bacterium]
MASKLLSNIPTGEDTMRSARETGSKERFADGVIARELEKRGVPRDASLPLAERLARYCRNFDRHRLAAALDGAAAAWAVQYGDAGASTRSTRGVREIERLMQGFAEEMRKLEEGLHVVSAYLIRMQNAARSEGRDRHS